MPRTESVITIFISSPSDVSAEREVLEAIISELNRTWSSSLGVRLEPIMWETHSRPSFGTDPQDVLNRQLPDDYDVFLGILWGRIGTPTPRAESGTVEEFYRAYERYKKDNNAVDLMVYFKDVGIPPSKAEPEQLTQIQQFKETLGKIGGLYSTFEDTSSFESSLRAHLSSLAQKFSSHNRSVSDTKNDERQSESATTLDDGLETLDTDLGFWDYADIYESQMDILSSTLNSISDATNRVGGLMMKRVTEINTLTEDERMGKPARKIVKMSSDDISRFAQTIKLQLPIYSEARRDAFHALSNLLALYEDFEDSESSSLSGLDLRLKEMLTEASGAEISLGSLRDSIADLPRLTGELNRAKRGAVKQLDIMLEEIDRTKSTVQNILESIGKIKQP